MRIHLGIFIVLLVPSASFAETLVTDSSAVTIIEGNPTAPDRKKVTFGVSGNSSDLEEGATLADHRACVYHLEGEVKVLKSGSEKWVPLQKGDFLSQGDQVRTGAHSTVEIYFDEFYLNSTRLEANTIAEFRSIEPTDIYLTDGSVYSSLEGLMEGTTYQIATPTAVASVRGTQFLKEYVSATQTENTSVLNGTVEVVAVDPGGSVNWNQVQKVRANENLQWERKTFLEKGFQAFRPKPLPAAMKQKMQEVHHQARKRMENFSGGEKPMKKMRERWQQMKAEPGKMQPFLKQIQEKQAPRNVPQPYPGKVREEIQSAKKKEIQGHAPMKRPYAGEAKKPGVVESQKDGRFEKRPNPMDPPNPLPPKTERK